MLLPRACTVRGNAEMTEDLLGLITFYRGAAHEGHMHHTATSDLEQGGKRLPLNSRVSFRDRNLQLRYAIFCSSRKRKFSYCSQNLTTDLLERIQLNYPDEYNTASSPYFIYLLIAAKLSRVSGGRE